MTVDTVTDQSIAKALLQLEQVDERRFRSTYNQDNFLGMIFGGQPLAQALAAAQRTVPDWPAHSCTGYFLRTGVIADPVDYDVELLRDGRRFAFRRVLATQKGQPIFDMLCSFQAPEPGLEHQFSEPIDRFPDPDSLPNVQQFVEANADRLPSTVLGLHRREFPIELRLIDPESVFFTKPDTAQRDFWFRLRSAEGVDDPRDHAALLAFMSDYWFAGTAASVHVIQTSINRMSFASLNHSLWIHAPARVDEWLLFRTESPLAGGGRGLARGMIYDRNGQQVATAVQEAAMRFMEPPTG